ILPARAVTEMSAFGSRADIKWHCEECPLLTHSGQSQVAIFWYAVTLCRIKRRYSMELIGGVVVEDPLGSAAEDPAAAACTDPPCSRHRQLHQAFHQHVDDCCRSP